MPPVIIRYFALFRGSRLDLHVPVRTSSPRYTSSLIILRNNVVANSLPDCMLVHQVGYQRCVGHYPRLLAQTMSPDPILHS